MGSMRNDNHTKTCESLKGCQACTSTSFGCVWCQDQCKWRTCQGASESKRKGRFNSGFSEDNVKDPEEEIKSRYSTSVLLQLLHFYCNYCIFFIAIYLFFRAMCLLLVLNHQMR